MISWGMIGTGDVTEQKSGPAFYTCEGSALYAVYNRTHGKALDYAKRHKVPVVHESIEALLSDPKVDAVYVATPPVTHKELALQVIASGKPLCLEKPMAMNRGECREIVEAAQKRNVPVYVTYYRRSMEKFKKIKELLDGGTIGKIGSVQVTQYQQLIAGAREGDIPWRVEPSVSGGGILVDMGSHVFDILDFLVGPIATISGKVTNYGGYYKAEDSAVAAFVFENGVLGAGTFNYNTDRWVDRIEIAGDKGRLIFSCFDNEPVEIFAGGREELLHFTPPEPVYSPFVKDMVGCLLSGDVKGYVETAVRPTELLDQLLATYHQ
ncbi:Gfo/Idh/MocA family protein [Desulforhopalus sp. IMCC35007]|uniref:Gfo/Idh/MocA family protein n=1 Tax=Desulforhopalus sp. IMCC35007 TaxID=2569543 RepID=UPI0010AE1999|nr:Gfo/Idh/MocA family oxidoreductase [Desulforhopalus sp. IMCC35007]TKB06901.1 Gfo/Idh/MocA family oxidoreductase [Desulforhopalus sp. IMCC35007]